MFITICGYLFCAIVGIGLCILLLGGLEELIKFAAETQNLYARIRYLSDRIEILEKRKRK